MTITSTLHSLRAHASTNRHRVPVHPEALPVVVPGEINDPATAAGAALALCRSRWDEVTLALYLDNQHRLVGHAVVATGWVQAALLSARPILAGADACQASTCILIRHRATESPAPRKPSNGPSGPSLQHVPGTGSLSSITWWWSAPAASPRPSSGGHELHSARQCTLLVSSDHVYLAVSLRTQPRSCIGFT